MDPVRICALFLCVTCQRVDGRYCCAVVRTAVRQTHSVAHGFLLNIGRYIFRKVVTVCGS